MITRGATPVFAPDGPVVTATLGELLFPWHTFVCVIQCSHAPNSLPVGGREQKKVEIYFPLWTQFKFFTNSDLFLSRWVNFSTSLQLHCSSTPQNVLILWFSTASSPHSDPIFLSQSWCRNINPTFPSKKSNTHTLAAPLRPPHASFCRIWAEKMMKVGRLFLFLFRDLLSCACFRLFTAKIQNVVHSKQCLLTVCPILPYVAL